MLGSVRTAREDETKNASAARDEVRTLVKSQEGEAVFLGFPLGKYKSVGNSKNMILGHSDCGEAQVIFAKA